MGKFETLSDVNISSPFKMKSDGAPSSSCGVSRALWNSSQDLVMNCLYCPFIVALGQNILPKDAFQAYIGQDAHFLHGFAEAYKSAICRCQPEEHEIRMQLQELWEGVEAELKLHNAYAKDWGVDVRPHKEPVEATKAYLKYIQDIVNSPNESIGSILSVLVPCLRLYAFLGCQLAIALGDIEEHAYAEWVTTYSSPDYLQLPNIAESIIDLTAASEPYEKLLRQYRAALKMEANFFNSQPYRPPQRSIGLFVVDFDDTCSASDTTGLIASTAISTTVQQKDPAAASALNRELQSKLEALVTNYALRRNALLDERLPDLEDPPEEFDMGWLGDFLDRLSEFDREMNQVVVDSGILAGVKKGSLSVAGASIPTKHGCLEVLGRALEAGIPTCTLSVNWSAEMVRAALAQNGLPVVVGDTEQVSILQAGSIVVYANELEYFGETSTGNIKRKVECAADKGHVFDELLLNMAIEKGTSEDGITVCVGDSMTDLQALISADVGILLGSNPLVQRVAFTAGIEIVPLVSAPLAADQQQDHARCILYEASSWREIEAFLFANQFKAPPRRLSSAKEATSTAVASGKIPTVLAIAGSDSGGGAGIQADIKTCAALGVFSTSAVTALTAQNTQGVDAVNIPPTEFLRKQICAVLSDVGADVVKTGMLPTPEVVVTVAEELQKHAVARLVVDPVTISTSGDALATQGVVEAIQAHLMPIATIITPNILEASQFLGGKRITDIEGMRMAAQELHQFGCQYVLVKGGHLAGEQGMDDKRQTGTASVTDIFFDGRNLVELSHPFVKTSNTHGTGCTLAAAIAAELAKGHDVPSAVQQASRYLWRAIERSVDLPIGKGMQKPMNHTFGIVDWGADLFDNSSEQGVHKRLRIPNTCDLRVYAVTDPRCNALWNRTTAEAVRLAIDGGTTIVQLREKDSDGGYFKKQAAEVLAVCRSHGVPLLINDRVDVALAVDADGVHVGQNDLPAKAVRRLIGPSKILGVSVKTVEEAVQAEADGADYLGAGAVYPTGTKESDVIGLERLSAICQAVNIPVCSIGGITISNAAETIAAGAAGAAVVSAIFAAESPAEASRDLRHVVDESLAKVKLNH